MSTEPISNVSAGCKSITTTSLVAVLLIGMLTVLPPPVATAGSIGKVTTKRLISIGAEPGVWLTGGRDFEQSYYSPLKLINEENVRQLGFAWQYEVDTTYGFEATPIVVDGVMFSSGPKGAVYALDAATGGERWRFSPDIDPSVMRKVCCGPVNRGVAVWEGVVYVGSLDGYLYALDAGTGHVRWKVDTNIDHRRGYTLTGAVYIAKDLVIVGNGGAEFDARGYVTAYDTKTGAQRWRFFTVPGDPKRGFEQPEMAAAAKTWDADSLWPVGLGGTPWDGMAYDPNLNLLYIGTGNGAPLARKVRSPAGGDNLYLSSILAINPVTGRLVWYYQTTPADNWDYDATQKMILADLRMNGRARQVIMQANKNGFFFVLDRRTGELLSAKPYVKVTWASHVDRKTGRPVETGQGDYSASPKLVFPSWEGGHNWQPMAFNPGTGLVYIPAIEAGLIFSMPKEPFVYRPGGYNNVTKGTYPVPGPLGLDGPGASELPPLEELTRGQPNPLPRGFLRAWDPIRQHVVWEIETSGPWSGRPAAMHNGGGVMSTAGNLVFQGRSTGELLVFDARNGQQLQRIEVGTGMVAAPMTYMANGQQYVAIMAGMGGTLGGLQLPGSAAYRYGNRGRIIAFKLDGGSVPLPPELIHDKEGVPRPPVARPHSIGSIREGAELFQRNCEKCHSNIAGGIFPDLRRMSEATHAQFDDILLKGTRVERGMGNFSGLLSPDEVHAIHDYLIDTAWKAYDATHDTP